MPVRRIWLVSLPAGPYRLAMSAPSVPDVVSRYQRLMCAYARDLHHQPPHRLDHGHERGHEVQLVTSLFLDRALGNLTDDRGLRHTPEAYHDAIVMLYQNARIPVVLFLDQRALSMLESVSLASPPPAARKIYLVRSAFAVPAIAIFGGAAGLQRFAVPHGFPRFPDIVVARRVSTDVPALTCAAG